MSISLLKKIGRDELWTTSRMTVDPPSSTLILPTFTSCCKVSFPRTWMQKLPAGPVRLALCRWKWNMSLDRTSSTELLWTYRTKLLSMSLWVKELAFCCLLIGSHRQVDSFFGLYFTWSSSQPHLGKVTMLYVRTGSWFSNVVVALRCLVCNTALVPSTTKRHLLAIRLMWAWWGLSKTVSVHNVCVVHAHGIWEPFTYISAIGTNIHQLYTAWVKLLQELLTTVMLYFLVCFLGKGTMLREEWWKFSTKKKQNQLQCV